MTASAMKHVWDQVFTERMLELTGLSISPALLPEEWNGCGQEEVPPWLLSAMDCLVNSPNRLSHVSYPGFETDVLTLITDYFKGIGVLIEEDELRGLFYKCFQQFNSGGLVRGIGQRRKVGVVEYPYNYSEWAEDLLRGISTPVNCLKYDSPLQPPHEEASETESPPKSPLCVSMDLLDCSVDRYIGGRDDLETNNDSLTLAPDDMINHARYKKASTAVQLQKSRSLGDLSSIEQEGGSRGGQCGSGCGQQEGSGTGGGNLVEAFSLLVELVGKRRRKHLELLLWFMKEVGAVNRWSCGRIILDGAVGSRDKMLSRFVGLIMGRCDDVCFGVVSYLMDHWREVFFAGTTIVSDRVNLILSQRQAKEVLEDDDDCVEVYCKKISLEEYEYQRLLGETAKSLRKLLDTIIKGDGLSDKERKSRLKSFENEYPHIYAERFQGPQVEQEHGRVVKEVLEDDDDCVEVYCKKISLEEYEDQRLLGETAKSLRELLDTIIKGDGLSDKERKSRLKSFENEYPHIYAERFQGPQVEQEHGRVVKEVLEDDDDCVEVDRYYCKKISLEEYEDQRLLGETAKSLRELLDIIIKGDGLSDIERKSRLKSFENEYPHIYAERFQGPQVEQEHGRVVKEVLEDDDDCVEVDRYYCKKISLEEYEDQRLLGETAKSLRELLDIIIKGDGLSDRERKSRLKSFENEYPHIYAERFQGPQVEQEHGRVVKEVLEDDDDCVEVDRYYCKKISLEEYEDQRLLGETAKSLRELLDIIIKGDGLSDRERKSRLKSFENEYPHIYAERFQVSQVEQEHGRVVKEVLEDDDDCVEVNSYCKKISLEEYEDQRLLGETAKSLRELLDIIIKGDGLSDKERKSRLKSFENEYPHIYAERFQGPQVEQEHGRVVKEVLEDDDDCVEVYCKKISLEEYEDQRLLGETAKCLRELLNIIIKGDGLSDKERKSRLKSFENEYPHIYAERFQGPQVEQEHGRVVKEVLEDDDDCVEVNSYCKKISLEEYEDQRLLGETAKSLRELLDIIIKGDGLSDRERKSRLKSFENEYPHIYAERFQGPQVEQEHGRVVKEVLEDDDDCVEVDRYYCKKISLEEYEDQRLLGETAKSLRELLDIIIKGDGLSDKERKSRLKSFEDEYPHIYAERFQGPKEVQEE